MKRESVESSNIASIGYDAGGRILEVEFHDGGVYDYFDVPPEVFTDFMAASSKGQYFHRHIKDVYQYERVE